MRTTGRAGIVGFGALAAWLLIAAPATAQELSEKSVRSFMDYAWSLTPAQFSKQDGTVIVIDKKKPEDVLVPLDVAREIIKVGRMSAHAQVCGLGDHQIINHRSLMKREEEKKIWSDQQLVYINQLHLATVMLLTGKIRVVEKDGDKEVVIDEGKPAAQTCTDEQRAKVRDAIIAYVESGPNFKVPAGPIGQADAAPAATGSTTPAAAAVPAAETKP